MRKLIILESTNVKSNHVNEHTTEGDSVKMFPTLSMSGSGTLLSHLNFALGKCGSPLYFEGHPPDKVLLFLSDCNYPEVDCTHVRLVLEHCQHFGVTCTVVDNSGVPHELVYGGGGING